MQALPGIIGRKAFRRRSDKSHLKDQSLTLGKDAILLDWRYLGATRTVGVGVKSVDIDRNSEGEGK